VAEHGRKECYDPWALRQIGVHHEYHEKRNEHIFIILNPSEELGERIQSLARNTSPIDLHHYVLRAATGQWNQYIDYLEGQCGNLVGRKFFQLWTF